MVVDVENQTIDEILSNRKDDRTYFLDKIRQKEAECLKLFRDLKWPDDFGWEIVADPVFFKVEGPFPKKKVWKARILCKECLGLYEFDYLEYANQVINGENFIPGTLRELTKWWRFSWGVEREHIHTSNFFSPLFKKVRASVCLNGDLQDEIKEKITKFVEWRIKVLDRLPPEI
jgi:hypothetical protein